MPGRYVATCCGSCGCAASDGRGFIGLSAAARMRSIARGGWLARGCSVSRKRTSAVVSGGREVLAVGGHVAAALQHLADELVLTSACRHFVERRTALTAEPPSEWQLRHCFSWKTTAPWRSSAEALCRYFTGTASPLQASICGLQGV